MNNAMIRTLGVSRGEERSMGSWNMLHSVSAELLLLRKRTATRVLLGLWATLTVFFAYVLPYVDYNNASGPRAQELLGQIIPGNLVANVIVGFPFFGGTFAIMLGVLSVGSEYGWGTLKTLFTQRPGRLQVFASKLLALGIVLLSFVLVSFAVGAVASSVVVMLAVATRGTSLAIGIGILYTLVVEGLLSAIAGQVSILEPIVEFFVRANAYSLTRGLGVAADATSENGPGSYNGPWVDSVQAIIGLGVYVTIFLGVSAFLLRRRDVSG